MSTATSMDDLGRCIKAMNKQIEILDPALAEPVRLFKKAQGLKREQFERITPKTFSGLLTGTEIEKVMALKSISGILLFSLYKNYQMADDSEGPSGVRLIRQD